LIDHGRARIGKVQFFQRSLAQAAGSNSANDKQASLDVAYNPSTVGLDFGEMRRHAAPT
jgi:hypothetical protein